MRSIKNKLLLMVSSGLFLLAIQAVNVFSENHMYQDKEPECLKKYDRY